MKTTTRKRRVKKTKAQVLAKPLKLVVPVYKKAPAEICGSCGAPAFGKWYGDNGAQYMWCDKPSCREKIQSGAPQVIRDRYTMRPRPAELTPGYLQSGTNEIELVIRVKGKSPSVIRGRNARYCYNAWLESIFPTDMEKLIQLYHIAPRSRYLVYDSDGRLRGKTRNYSDAEVLAGKNKVVVYWGGR